MSPLAPGRCFYSDISIHEQDGAICFSLERGEGDKSDVVEFWIPASAAVHAGAALLVCHFGADQAARVQARLRREWERKQGWLPEEQQDDGPL